MTRAEPAVVIPPLFMVFETTKKMTSLCSFFWSRLDFSKKSEKFKKNFKKSAALHEKNFGSAIQSKL